MRLNKRSVGITIYGLIEITVGIGGALSSLWITIYNKAIGGIVVVSLCVFLVFLGKGMLQLKLFALTANSWIVNILFGYVILASVLASGLGGSRIEQLIMLVVSLAICMLIFLPIRHFLYCPRVREQFKVVGDV